MIGIRAAGPHSPAPAPAAAAAAVSPPPHTHCLSGCRKPRRAGSIATAAATSPAGDRASCSGVWDREWVVMSEGEMGGFMGVQVCV